MKRAHWTIHPVRRLAVAAGLACLAWSVAVPAQPQIERAGRYTLRSTVVGSQSIAEETARSHGIEPAADTAVLNVVVLIDKNGTPWPVRADVTAQRTSLAGVVRKIEMREVANRGRVSYVGSFDFVPREVVDLTVTARPDTGAAPLTMTYRERMPPTQLPPASR